MNKEMQKKIHKFVQNGMYILLDVNSGCSIPNSRLQ